MGTAGGEGVDVAIAGGRIGAVVVNKEGSAGTAGSMGVEETVLEERDMGAVADNATVLTNSC